MHRVVTKIDFSVRICTKIDLAVPAGGPEVFHVQFLVIVEREGAFEIEVYARIPLLEGEFGRALVPDFYLLYRGGGVPVDRLVAGREKACAL